MTIMAEYVVAGRRAGRPGAGIIAESFLLSTSVRQKERSKESQME